MSAPSLLLGSPSLSMNTPPARLAQLFLSSVLFAVVTNGPAIAATPAVPKPAPVSTAKPDTSKAGVSPAAKSTAVNAAELSKQTGAAKLGPAPTKFLVKHYTGDVSEHDISWNSVENFTKFIVYRDTPSGSKVIGEGVRGENGLKEYALVAPNTRYRLVVQYPDGSEGSAEYLWRDPPQAETVTGLKAVQEAVGTLKIYWNKLPLTWDFMVFFPSDATVGRPASGNTNSITITGVSPGKYKVRVAPAYRNDGGVEVRLGNAWADAIVTSNFDPATVHNAQPVGTQPASHAAPNTQNLPVNRRGPSGGR